MNIVWRTVQLALCHHNRSVAMSIAHRTLQPALVRNGQQQLLCYSSKSPREPPTKSSTPTNANRPGGAAKSKQQGSPKITLISPDQSVAVVNLDEAQKISKRRDLKLVKIVDLDVKTQRPIYKLMTSAEYLTEDLKRREEKKRSKQEATVKGDKLLSISARISEHDLASKVQNVLKWLKKSYEVRISISGDGDKSKQEAVAAQFESSSKEMGKVVQKRFRDNDLRFSIIPASSVTGKSEPSKSSNPIVQNTPVEGKKVPLDGPEKQPSPVGVGGQQQVVRAFHTGRPLLA